MTLWLDRDFYAFSGYAVWTLLPGTPEFRKHSLFRFGPYWPEIGTIQSTESTTKCTWVSAYHSLNTGTLRSSLIHQVMPANINVVFFIHQISETHML